jgi:Ca2+-binding EF-hand superfamily protein
MDRLKELKTNYNYERGDKPVSETFQRVYNVVVPLILFSIIGLILFFILEAALFFLPSEYPLIITIVLISWIPILLIKNAFFDDSWKNSILVKKADGGYEFRFRKDSTIAATWRKMAIDYVDRDGDGKLTFEEVLRAIALTANINIPKEEKEELRLKFEKLDVDKDGFVNVEDALKAFNQESIICKVYSKEFEPDIGTKEFEFEICGETEDCKNKLWKL